MGGGNANTNTNEIKIDLGGLGGKDDKETNIAQLAMTTDPQYNIYCPVCDKKGATTCDKHMTDGGCIYYVIMFFIFWPVALCVLCDSNNWGHTHKCATCRTTLFSKK